MNNYYAGPEMMNQMNMEGMAQATETENIVDMGQMDSCCNPCAPKVPCEPIYECPQERVCHKYTTYEVPHIMPCHTRVVNHHVYRHTYTPCYTCCEENVVCHINDRKCC